MWTFNISLSRGNIFSIQQLNPQLHSDSVNDIDGFRHLLPSAPPLSQTNSQLNNQATTNRRNQNAHISCPICLSTAVLPIETNCGHLFCGSFFLSKLISFLIYIEALWHLSKLYYSILETFNIEYISFKNEMPCIVNKLTMWILIEIFQLNQKILF